MQLSITKVFRTDKDKVGNDLKTRDGRRYERVLIKTQEYGDKWLSGFGNNSNVMWREGDKINIEVEEIKKGDNIYLNFKTLDKLDLLEKEIATLTERITVIETTWVDVLDSNNPILDKKTENKPMSVDDIPTIETELEEINSHMSDIYEERSEK